MHKRTSSFRWLVGSLLLLVACGQSGPQQELGACVAGRSSPRACSAAPARLGAQDVGGGTTFLSDLAWTSAVSAWGPVEKDRSNGEQDAGDGRPLSLGGQTFDKGLGMHADGEVRYALDGQCSTLRADVGIDDEVGDRGSAVFQVWDGDRKLLDSGVVRGADPARPVEVGVEGVRDLRLVVTGAGDNLDYDHADWAGARLDCAPTRPVPAPPPDRPAGWTPLFNGRDLSGWTTWLPSQGANRDPEGVFKVEGGLLHVLDLPVTGRDQEFGYVGTTVPYADYRLRMRYRWGTKKFVPRADAPRDAGLMYGVTGPDGIWPTSAEFQIQERDTGDLWLIGGTNATVRVADPGADPRQYRENGTPYTTANGPGDYGRVVKSADAERPTDWNDLELIVSGDEATHIVNGQVVNQLSGLRAPNGAPLTSGRILLQAEGAEVWYAGVLLRPLAYTPPPPGATVLFGGQDASAWRMRGGGGAVNWPVEAGALVVNPSGNPEETNDIRTADTYRDFRLHLEFKVPHTDPNLGEQARGNSGVYLQGRYELQILDSFGRAIGDKNDLGALYGVRDPSTNASLPAGVWQSYDVVFRAARWSEGTKTGGATVTAWLNGDLVQDGVELPGPTLLGDPEADTPGPVVLQDHGNRVQFRNIWIEPL